MWQAIGFLLWHRFHLFDNIMVAFIDKWKQEQEYEYLYLIHLQEVNSFSRSQVTGFTRVWQRKEKYMFLITKIAFFNNNMLSQDPLVGVHQPPACPSCGHWYGWNCHRQRAQIHFWSRGLYPTYLFFLVIFF